MNCDQLQTFQAVATTGSFTKASRKLLLSQPAVSQQIQALEASLRVRLFDRTGKKIHLTREGELLLSKTSKITDLLQEIRSLFDDLTNLDRGRLDIGSSAIFGAYLLPHLIGKFHSQHPSIEIDLHAGNSHKIISMLLNGDIEFGFGGLFEDEPKINYLLIHQEQLVAVVGSQHPLATLETVTPESLKSVPLILREKGTRIRRDMEAWFGNVDKSFFPKRCIELENVEIAKKLIEEGVGMTIVPRVAVQRELDTGLLKTVDLPNLDLNAYYYLYYPRHRKLSQAAKAFLALLPQAVSLSQGIELDGVIA